MLRSFLDLTRSPVEPAGKILRASMAALSALFLVSATLSSAWAGAWKGQETTKDGTLHIMNTAEPMEEPGEVRMKELWRLGGDTDDEDEFFGVISGDLNSRRALISGSDVRGAYRVLSADVPLASMFGYATQLRSLSQGRASWSMEPSHYAAVPSHVAEKVMEGMV